MTAARWVSIHSAFAASLLGFGDLHFHHTRFPSCQAGGTGYYDYQTPLQTEIQGQVIHPQFWPEEEERDHWQRRNNHDAPPQSRSESQTSHHAATQSYLHPLGTKFHSFMATILPPNNALPQTSTHPTPPHISLLFDFCQTFPNFSRWILQRSVSSQLPPHIPYDPHLRPSYNPWDQRLCVSPDGRLSQESAYRPCRCYNPQDRKCLLRNGNALINIVTGS